MLLLLLGGCAAAGLERKGLAMLEQGQVEEGITLLDQAAKMDPENLGYRAELIRNRDRLVTRLLASALNDRSQQRFDAALATYAKVLRVDPGNRNGLLGIDLVTRERLHGQMMMEATDLAGKNERDAATALLKKIILENPAHKDALALLKKIDEQNARQLTAAISLSGKFKKPVALQFRDANIKLVFEALSRISGVNVLLDKDVKPDTRVSIFVKDVSVEDAIDLILLQSQLEKKVLSDSTLFVYPNTAAKQKEFQDLKIRSFHLTNADPKQISAMLKALLKTKDLFVHEKTNSIIIRDTPDAIALAERLVADQDVADPEVMLELEVLEITGSRLYDLGVQFPTQVNVALQGAGGTVGTGPLSIQSLRNINAGNLILGSAPALTVNLLMQDGMSNLLASPRIRAKNREKAKIMIGDRVPVLTNAVTPVSTGTPVITGSVQYLDVGLKLEVEADIHQDDEVSIKIALEVSAIVKEVQNAVSGTLAYQIGTRNASTVLRLKDGETQILGGLISNEDRNTASHLPAIGQLPILGKLFSSTRDDFRKSEIVLSITPHIITHAHVRSNAANEDFWTGTDASLRAKLLLTSPVGLVATGRVPGASGKPPDATTAPVGLPLPILQPPPPPGQPGPPAPSLPTTSVPPPPVQDRAPVSFLLQGPAQAKVKEKINVTFNANAFKQISAIDFGIAFDPAALRLVDVVEGLYFRRGSSKSRFTKDVNVRTGVVTLSTGAADQKAATGAGSVATAIFEVISVNTGETRITLNGASASGMAQSKDVAIPSSQLVIALTP